MRWFFSRGWHGWILIVAALAFFDTGAAFFNGESMTYATRRWSEHAAGRALVVVTVVAVAVHLLGLVPAAYDPLDRTYEWLQGRRSRHEQIHGLRSTTGTTDGSAQAEAGRRRTEGSGSET